MKRQIQKYFRPFLAVIGLMAIAAAVSFVILTNQRLRFPLITPKPIAMEVEFDNAQAVTPGQGQTVQVAGVKIGDIGEVKLREGRAVVRMDIEPEFKDVIHTDAKATLRPRTGLKDMYIQVYPGSQDAPLAKEGFVLPISRTLTDVDLDEILASLDGDTRDYLQLLVNGAGGGLRSRGSDLAEVFRRFQPTFRDLAKVSRAVAREDEALKDTINSFARLNRELARRPEDLTQLVDSSAATFRAFASEDDNLSRTVELLPPMLSQARATLRDVQPFADALGPAARKLVPAFQALEETNPKVRELAREATPTIREDIRPFVRATRPLTRELRPAAQGLSATSRPLTRSIKVFNTFFNMLGYNDGGKQAPAPGRDEGYLFWLAWVQHQGINLINVDDANGPMRPIFLTGTCTTLQNLVEGRPEIEFGMALSPLFANLCGDPETASTDLPLARKRSREQDKAFAREDRREARAKAEAKGN